MDNFYYKNAINWALSLDIREELQLSLLCLVAQIDTEGRCELTKAEWAAMRGKTTRTLTRHQKSLDELGLVKVIHQQGAGNVFFINAAHIEDNWFEGKIERYGQKKSRPNLPSKWKWDTFEKSDYKCTYCGSTKFLEIDHIIPLAKGGSHTPENLQTLCMKCNSAKSDNL